MTEEQLSYIKSLGSKEEIIIKLHEWFGVDKLESGKWFKANGATFNFSGKFDEDGDPLGFGFLPSGRWSELDHVGWPINDDLRLATEKDVKELLVNEAISRGFVEDAIFKSTNGVSFVFRDFSFSDILQDHYVWNSGSGMIFDNGIWAKVVKTITKKEAEKQLGKIII